MIIVSSHHPRKLLEYLKEFYVVTEISEGIYSIKNGPFKIYVISLRKLPSDQNLLLTSLQFNLPEERYNQIIAKSVNREDDNTFQVFINTFLKINKEKFIKGEIKMHQTTIDLMKECGLAKPFIKIGKKMGEKRGKANGMFAAKADAIIAVLTERLEVPPKKLQEQIRNVRSIEKLDELIRFAATCVSIGEFSTALN
jgi:hypothetical protein